MTHSDMPLPLDLLSQSNWVRGLARALVLDSADAEDVAQEALLRSLGGARDVRSPKAWLGAIARNVHLDRTRGSAARAARERAVARVEATASTHDVVALVELQQLVVREVLALDEHYRDVVLLAYFDELPPREIARRLGVPVATVRTRSLRAREQLRRRLASRYGDERAWCAALLPLAALHAPLRRMGARVALAAVALVVVAAGTWLGARAVNSANTAREVGVAPALHAFDMPASATRLDSVVPAAPAREPVALAPTDEQGVAPAADQAAPRASAAAPAAMTRVFAIDRDGRAVARSRIEARAADAPNVAQSRPSAPSDVRAGATSGASAGAAPSTSPDAVAGASSIVSTTDERGAFELPKQHKSRKFTALDPELAVWAIGSAVDAANVSHPLLLLGRATTWRARFVDERGEPIAGLRVRVLNSGVGLPSLPDALPDAHCKLVARPLLQALVFETDAGGCVDTAELPALDGWQWQADDARFSPLPTPFEPAADRELVLAARSQAGATSPLAPVGPDARRTDAARSDADRERTEPRGVAVVRGRVVDARGAPVEGARIDIVARGRVDSEIASFQEPSSARATTTDSSGVFELRDVRARSVQLLASSVDGSHAVLSRLLDPRVERASDVAPSSSDDRRGSAAATARADESQPEPDVVLRWPSPSELGLVRGRVLDLRGAPVVGVHVSVGVGIAATPGIQLFRAVRSTRSAADGGYELRDVLREGLELRVGIDADAETRIALALSEAESTLDVRVAVPCRVALTDDPSAKRVAPSTCRFFDAAGRALTVFVGGSSGSGGDGIARGPNGFPLVSVSQAAVSVALFEGDREVARRSLELVAAGVNMVSL